MSDKYTGFQRRVMEIFYLADVRDDLLWHVKDDQLHLSADVSDIFDWASADSEAITPETLPVLEKAYEDLEAVDGLGYLADLYGARMRRQRPQGAAYPDDPKVIELLHACGPPRGRDLSNPRHPPEPIPPMDPKDVVDPQEYPYSDGEFIVLGPEIFVTNDGGVICWKGVNYVLQNEGPWEVIAERAAHPLIEINIPLEDA
jgi:hypothetical protein